jgi:hypothetical protein
MRHEPERRSLFEEALVKENRKAEFVPKMPANFARLTAPLTSPIRGDPEFIVAFYGTAPRGGWLTVISIGGSS